jgi:hypothetical protein
MVLIDVGRIETNAVTLARRFDDPAFARPSRRLALPARRRARRDASLLGCATHGAWTDLQSASAPVFEIPTLPPSAPGVRLFDARAWHARRDADQGRASSPAHEGQSAPSAPRPRYAAGAIVLATGGRERRHRADPRGRLGLSARAAQRRPIRPLCAAVRAGRNGTRCSRASNERRSCRPGADARREGSGEGIALSTGHHVAERIAA